MRAASRFDRVVPRGALVFLGGVVSAALVAGWVSPAWSAEPDPGGSPSVELGGFAIGDGLEGAIGEADGSFAFSLSAGGVELSWDSRAVGTDRYGLGAGWGMGLAYVETAGGVRVFPSSGGAFAMDASAPSGLSGYPERDVVFRSAAEADAIVPGTAGGAAVVYAYELHELGGNTSYFSAEGDLVAQAAANGDLSRWSWEVDAEGRHRLTRIVSPDGVETELDWSDPAALVVRPGASVTSAPEGSGAGGEWRVRFGEAGVSAVIEPTGSETRLETDDLGRLERVSTASGSETVVTWHETADAVARVDRVSVLDESSAELSFREWRQTSGAAPTGWPVIDPSTRLAGPGDAAIAPHAAELTDGSTRISTTFDGAHRMTRRTVSASTSAGELVLREQRLGYAGESAGDGESRPRSWSKPSSSTVTYRDAAGGERTGSEAYEFDALGRLVRRESADGRVMERAYDEVVPGDRLVPIGLPTSERTTAPDGSFVAVDYELSEDRTAPVVTETTTTAPGLAAEVTARTEFEVEGGLVTERRVFPRGDTSAPPLITRWAETVDPAAGVTRTTETTAAGTALEVTGTTETSLVHGGVLVATGAAGATTRTTYDSAGRAVSSVDPAGRVLTTAYRTERVDGINAVTVTGPDGVAVTEVRDALGRVERKYDNITPSGEPAEGHVRVSETRKRPAAGVEEVTDAWGATTRIQQDVLGRPVEVTLPNGLVELTKYDDIAGTTTTASTPTGSIADAERTVTTRIDEAGRVTGATGTRADGLAVPETSSVYDGLGRQVATSNGVTRTRADYDAAGNPVTTAVHELEAGAEASASPSLVAERRFDRSGQSLEKTMTAGGESRSGGSRELDVLGRTIVETDQRGASTRYEYTVDGLVSREVADDGRETRHTYDDDTRALLETRVTTAGSTVATGFEYDDRTGALLAVFDADDRARSEISYEYDAFGNVRSVQYPSGEPGVPGERIEHEYDEHGRKVATVDVAGNRTEFRYADDGFLIEAVQVDASGDRVLAGVTYTPDAFGRVQTIARDNGVVTDYAFTSAGEIASETTTRGDDVLARRDYEYDPSTGNLSVRVDRTLDEATGDTAIERREYAYDALGRLVASTVRDGATAGAPATLTTAYEIGVSGQVAAETVTTDPGAATETTRERRLGYSATGALERITTVVDGVEQIETQEYDAAGNLTRAADGTRFAWDAANRQIRETRSDGTEIATTYWADGSRRERATSAGATEFYWDAGTLVNDVHTATADAYPDGSAAYLIGTSRHARTVHADAGGDVASETGYYGTDRHGNVTSITDESGATSETYEYSDYGVPAAARGGQRAALPGGAGDLRTNPYRYASQYTHDDGTQFLQERTYDPELMSLTSEDRERLHNRYGYADANPIMLVDPSGRFSVMDRVAVALGVFGAMSSFSGAVLAFTGGGLGLTVFGVAAGLVGIADAAFTAAETGAILTDTRFMSEEAAVGVGAGLAAAGLLLNVPGAIARYLKSRAPKIGAQPGAQTGDQPGAEPGPAESGQPSAAPLVEPDELEGVPKVVQNAQQLVVRALPRFAIEDVLETVTDTNPRPMWLRNARATAVYHATPLGADGVIADARSPFDVAQSTIEKLSKMRDALVVPQGALGGSYARQKLTLIEGHLSDATKWLILHRARSAMVLSDDWLSMDPYFQQLSVNGLNHQAFEFETSVTSALMEAERLQARNIVAGADELFTSLQSLVGNLDGGLLRRY